VSPLVVLLASPGVAAAPVVVGAPAPRTLPTAGKLKGEEADVVVATSDATCRLERAPITTRGDGTVSVTLGVHGDTLATWAAQQGELSAVAADGKVPPCDLPGVESVVVPAGGWAIGVHHPAVELHVDGPVTLAPLGEDGHWWHAVADAPGEANLAVVHAEAPPTRLRLVLDPEAGPPEGRTILVGPRGATAVPVEAPIVALSMPATDVARVEVMGAHLVAFGHSTGRADGIVRVEGLVPEALAVVVQPKLPAPQGSAWAVSPGGSRRLKPDVPVVQAISADPDVVSVEVKPSRLVLEAGECAYVCEADVAVLDETGMVHVVRVVVH
jgi:hypothetical protein